MMNFLYKSLIKPFLFGFDAERAHHAILRIGRWLNESPTLLHALQSQLTIKHPYLESRHIGCAFPNPVGLAAGFDKNGEITQVIEALGFGFMEVGSITAEASEGNPIPRLFRLPLDQALINRMGLNNHGAQIIVNALQGRTHEFPLGINIAKTHNPVIVGDNALRDYQRSFIHAEQVADFITINISCPNTTEGKTFEDSEALRELLTALRDVRTHLHVPLLVKFSVDLSPEYLLQLADVCEQSGWVSGYVCCNTSSTRHGLQSPSLLTETIGRGGLSGAPLTKRSSSLISALRTALGPKPLIIGVGGVRDYTSARAKFTAGADLIELYTGLVYEGPFLATEINKAILDEMQREGITQFSEYLKSVRS